MDDRSAARYADRLTNPTQGPYPHLDPIVSCRQVSIPRVVSFCMEWLRKRGLAQARNERCLSPFSGTVTIDRKPL